MTTTAIEVTRTNRLDRPYEVLSRPVLNRLLDTWDTLVAFQREFLTLHGDNAAPHDNAAPLIARVNYGRWLGDCACGDAPVIDPVWLGAVCLTCGSIYTTSIVLPPDWAAIDAALMLRAFPWQRNWTTAETLADLLADNAANGL